jgi:diaminopimelate decarboxylase
VRAHPAGPRHGEQLVEAEPTPVPASDGRLDARLWPAGASRGSDGVVRLRGRVLADLVAEHGTPALLLDEEDFRARARGFRTAFGDRADPDVGDRLPAADVYYAAKAFLSVELARWVEQEGLGLDVASRGELEVALLAGFPASRMVLHGNNKSVGELQRAVGSGVGRVVIDSFDEIDRLAVVAAEAGCVQPVLVRVTVGVEAHTHEFIATAHEDQKFGFSLSEGSAADAVSRVLSHRSLQLAGVHSHIGSQIFDTSGFEVAAHRAVGFLAAVRDTLGVTVPELNLGGGLGVAYVEGDDPADLTDFAESLRTIVRRECSAYRLPLPRLAIEPGRAVVGPSAVTMYEVGTVKPVVLDGGRVRHYVSVDGGMSDNVRTALYDAEYTVTLASRWSTTPPVRARVVGQHCESGDIVVRDAWLPGDVAPGDLLAVAATGAYCRAMASSYNLVGRPPVVAVRVDGSTQVLLRRETLPDLLRLDPAACDAVVAWEA